MKFGTGELLISVDIFKFWLKSLTSFICSELQALLRAFGMSMDNIYRSETIFETEVLEELKKTFWVLGFGCD